MKHIVLYVNSIQPAGGIERVIATLAKRLISVYKVSVLVKDEPKSFYPLPENVNIVSMEYPLELNMNSRLSRIWILISNLMSVGKKLNLTFNKLNADYIYVTTPYACLETKLAKIPKAKVIISEHGSRTNYNWVYRLMKHLLYKKYPVQIVPTERDCQWYKERGYPAVHIPHFRSDLPYKKSKLESKIVLNIGRLTDDKNQLALLRIWKRVYGRIMDKSWKLRIAGDGENRSLLENYIENNALSSVEIVPPIKNVEKYYNDCSIYVSTSRSEGFPMVLVEAVSFGLPTVAFDCPTGPDEILNEEAGVLVELHNEDVFEEELVKLTETADLRKKYSDNAFERSVNWGDDKILEKWENIFE